MPQPIPCCVDLPSGVALVRYGLAELLRGLGLEPVWAPREDARLVVTLEGAPASALSPGEGGVLWETSLQALDGLAAPRVPAVADLGWTKVDGERWPVPVGPPGPTDRLGDLVAAAAWGLAGLQEQAITVRDRHGRVPFERTLQAALGDHPGGPLRPAVDAYRRRLASALRAAGVEVPGRTWGGHAWAVALTHDLDAVRTRRLRALAGSLRRGELAEAGRRALGPDRRRQSIEELHALAERHGTAATWFVKPGAWSPEDVPGGLDPWLVGRLRGWAEAGHEVGWHPGYGAVDDAGRLRTERERFEAAFGSPPRLARSHFLRWPDGLAPALAAHGVRADSTLGFAEHEGFRRGTAHPFRLVDIEGEAAGDLWEVPLAVMDTTLADYRGLDAAAQADALDRVFAAARAAGGVAVVLWHNQIGGGDAAWRERLATLDASLGRARAAGARLGPLGRLLTEWVGESTK